jgi:hypothetical protein
MALLLTETTLYFHDFSISTEKPPEPAWVTTWSQALASARATRDRSQTFGSGSKQWPSANHVASVSSGSILTPSSLQGSEVGANIVRKFGGLEDEKDDSDDFLMVLEEGPNAVRGTNFVAAAHSHCPFSLSVGSQS